jgi:cytochrome P450
MPVQTLRWRPVAAGGIPHLLTQDDTYGDYFLPKGTMLFANAWAIHREEGEYDHPEEFMPERFLDNKFGTRFSGAERLEDNNSRITYGFGAGRRVCPGQRLAENSLVCHASLAPLELFAHVRGDRWSIWRNWLGASTSLLYRRLLTRTSKQHTQMDSLHLQGNFQSHLSRDPEIIK